MLRGLHGFFGCVLLFGSASVARPATVGEEPPEQPEIFLAGVGDVSNPEIVFKADTTYPILARDQMLEATVIYQAVITEAGDVQNIKVLRCEVWKHGKKKGKKKEKWARHCVAFEKAGRDSIRRWKYRPATREGEPVNVYFTVNASFTIRK